MKPDLSRRLARAVDVGGATPDERQSIIDAAQKAATFDDLPTTVRELIQRLETPPKGVGLA